MGKVALIDYGVGNLHSACRALVAAGADAVTVTADPTIISQSSHVVLPGVGAFAACMQQLQKCEGLIEALHHHLFYHHRPFLGICVGMQLMMEYGTEHGHFQGLGWVEGSCRAFDNQASKTPRRKIPHMGWNDVQLCDKEHPILKEMDGQPFYFVHSYYVDPKKRAHVLALSDYEESFAAIIGCDTMIGTQFHPEKSHKMGIMLLRRFLAWKP